MPPDSEDQDQPRPRRRRRWLQNLQQQQLPLKTPTLNVVQLAGCWGCGGGLLIIIGVLILSASLRVVTAQHQYSIEDPNVFRLHIEKTMRPPINVYYELSHFYQSGAAFEKNRCIGRDHCSLGLQPEELVNPARMLRSGCMPNNSSQGRPLYPCGVFAKTVFTDRFVLFNESGTIVPVDDSARAISWGVDIDSFNKDTLHPTSLVVDNLPAAVTVDMWVLKFFPPVLCRADNLATASSEAAFIFPDNTNVSIADVSPYVTESVEVLDCFTESGMELNRSSWNVSNCKFQGQAACPLGYTYELREDFGVNSGQFINWMRGSGIPRFRKLYGVIHEELPPGWLSVHLRNIFNESDFNGTKSLVLETTTRLGGAHTFLGVCYLAMGFVCVVYGLVFYARANGWPRYRGRFPPSPQGRDIEAESERSAELRDPT
mmetsp:Transcript_77689/g.177909  ORF Transcript_77689/g.177909 Transcript_77689/m.177909 type:complete len:430 (-) Transcript_77689:181-1470(-)